MKERKSLTLNMVKTPFRPSWFSRAPRARNPTHHRAYLLLTFLLSSSFFTPPFLPNGLLTDFNSYAD